MSYTPKGLATVALLKTRLDDGYDHLALFEPLVRDGLAHVSGPEFGIDDVKAVLQERTGILLPGQTLKTLLGRFVRQGTIRKISGRFCLQERPKVDAKIDIQREDIRAQQQLLGHAFVKYAADAGLALDNADAALEILAIVASENKVPLILEEPLPDSPLDRSTLPRKATRTAARFITQHCIESPSLKPALQSLVEGVLLYDALFLCDGTDASQRFQGLTVAIDTRILFSALNLAGIPSGIATREGLSLLREVGARIIAFDRTVDEMRRVLAYYEARLATPSGIANLRPTDLKRHFLGARYSPADVRIISATLETRLQSAGVAVVPLPEHKPQFTFDEQLLAEMLCTNAQDEIDSPRVRHDVDAVAAVLTLRNGKMATAIERSVAIFCSATGKVVHNTQEWFRAQQQSGTPPVIHQAALTSIAWLKKPAAAPGIKLHELVALCASALQPTRATWSKFAENLRKLRDEGTIRDDETAAIVASELTEPLLANLDEEDEPDTHSILGVIERVREAYRREASAQANESVSIAQADRTLARKAAEDALRTSQAETAMAQDAMATKDAALNALGENIAKSSRFKANIVFYFVAAINVAAIGISLPGMFSMITPGWKWVSGSIAVFAAIPNIWSLIRGGSLLAWRDQIADALSRRARNRFLAEPAIPSAWCDRHGSPSSTP